MYLNFKLISKKDLHPYQILILQAIKQNSKGSNENLLKDLCNFWGDDTWLEGYITLLKGDKETEFYKIVRLSKTGKKVLEDVQIAGVEEWHITLSTWIKSMYELQDKKIGNFKRFTRGLAQFSQETGITKNHLGFLFKVFLNDDDQMEYSFKAETVLFSSKNMYSRAFNLDECRLWTYYQSKQQWFDNKFVDIPN